LPDLERLEPPAAEASAAIDVWRRIIQGEGKVWALFQHGTCVIFAPRTPNVADAAITLLRKWGPVHAGSPAGDFSVIELEHESGCVVTCHHPDILTYVPLAESGSRPSELAVGLLGRSLRDSDAAELNVVYVEGDSEGEPIHFYSKLALYRELSNFSAFGFEADGMHWPTVEHYFQAQKFPGSANAEYREKIRLAKDAKQAKALGRTRTIAIRDDWDTVRDQVMLSALRRKFAPLAMRELLLNTGLRQLVEASPIDSYWGRGRAGTGKNRLGQLLMQVRAELRSV
jgi:ribA/ribD-fused uncharacterized protein